MDEITCTGSMENSLLLPPCVLLLRWMLGQEGKGCMNNNQIKLHMVTERRAAWERELKLPDYPRKQTQLRRALARRALAEIQKNE